MDEYILGFPVRALEIRFYLHPPPPAVNKKRKGRNEDLQDEVLSFYALLALSSVARADYAVLCVAYLGRKYV